MKRLLILGGDHFILPVVKAAKEQGYHVITCDYLPHNVAHKYSDEYINHSTTDREGILFEAEKNKVDGILTFTDSGVITAAYVTNKLGLPSVGPFESVLILQNKALFRQFLIENGFNSPKAKGFSNKKDAFSAIECFTLPVIVKPVDSAGSKGVTKVEEWDKLDEALDYASQYSFSGSVIVESFIEKQGYSSDSDCFSVDGKLQIMTFSAQRFDENALGKYTPAAYSWPSSMNKHQEEYLAMEIQRLISLLGMRTSIYNIESRIGIDGKPYIMEVSPRGGGNRLAEMIRFSTGVDMITAAVRAAVGDELPQLEQKPLNGHWAEVILHVEHSGYLGEVSFSEEIKPYIEEIDLWYDKGQRVQAFQSARDAVGTLILKFQDPEHLSGILDNVYKYIDISVSPSL